MKPLLSWHLHVWICRRARVSYSNKVEVKEGSAIEPTFVVGPMTDSRHVMVGVGWLVERFPRQWASMRLSGSRELNVTEGEIQDMLVQELVEEAICPAS